jgi:hypothetical protein
MQSIIQDGEMQHIEHVLAKDRLVLRLDQFVDLLRKLLAVFLVLRFPVLGVNGIHGCILPLLHMMNMVTFAENGQARLSRLVKILPVYSISKQYIVNTQEG